MISIQNFLRSRVEFLKILKNFNNYPPFPGDPRLDGNFGLFLPLFSSKMKPFKTQTSCFTKLIVKEFKRYFYRNHQASEQLQIHQNLHFLVMLTSLIKAKSQIETYTNYISKVLKRHIRLRNCSKFHKNNSKSTKQSHLEMANTQGKIRMEKAQYTRYLKKGRF